MVYILECSFEQTRAFSTLEKAQDEMAKAFNLYISLGGKYVKNERINNVSARLELTSLNGQILAWNILSLEIE